MTDRELMQQAMEAMELAKNSHGVLLMSDPPQDPWKTRRVDSALTQSITALRDRLAQLKRTWVGLTDEEKAEIWSNNETAMVVTATEAKLKEKNT